MQEFDLIVIGGGSAGLKAARTAARLGRTVALAEERELGGECFWAGCVPTKAMVRAAQVWQLVRKSQEFGIHVEIKKEDFAAAMAYKESVLRKVAGDGPEDGGLSKYGAVFYKQRASFEGPREVRVGSEVIRGKQIVIASGTVPKIPNIPGLEEAGYITNREAVDLPRLPKHMVVLGAGPIGLEFAQVFRRFGSEVTVLAKDPQILPREDEDVAALAAGFLIEEGIRILTGCYVERVTHAKGTKTLRVRHHGGLEEMHCDEILVAVGRSAAVEGMNVEAAGVEFERRCIHVNRYLGTNVPHIWAAGDISGGYLFTHVASYEGKLVALNAFTDRPEPFDHRVVPRCTYIDPEVASIGITERQARELGRHVVTHSFSFANLDRAIIYGEGRGLVKLVVDELDGQILGAHLVGPDASSIIAELAICMKHHLPVSAIADTMHAYPSFPEAVEAAALSAPNYRGQVDGATG